MKNYHVAIMLVFINFAFTLGITYSLIEHKFKILNYMEYILEEIKRHRLCDHPSGRPSTEESLIVSDGCLLKYIDTERYTSELEKLPEVKSKPVINLDLYRSFSRDDYSNPPVFDLTNNRLRLIFNNTGINDATFCYKEENNDDIDIIYTLYDGMARSSITDKTVPFDIKRCITISNEVGDYRGNVEVYGISIDDDVLKVKE